MWVRAAMQKKKKRKHVKQRETLKHVIDASQSIFECKKWQYWQQVNLKYLAAELQDHFCYWVRDCTTGVWTNFEWLECKVVSNPVHEDPAWIPCPPISSQIHVILTAAESLKFSLHAGKHDNLHFWYQIMECTMQVQNPAQMIQRSVIICMSAQNVWIHNKSSCAISTRLRVYHPIGRATIPCSYCPDKFLEALCLSTHDELLFADLLIGNSLNEFMRADGWPLCAVYHHFFTPNCSHDCKLDNSSNLRFCHERITLA